MLTSGAGTVAGGGADSAGAQAVGGWGWGEIRKPGACLGNVLQAHTNLAVVRRCYERVSQLPKYSPVYRLHSFRDRKGGTPKSQRKKPGRTVLACSSRNIGIHVRRVLLLDGSNSLQIIDCASTGLATWWRCEHERRAL